MMPRLIKLAAIAWASVALATQAQTSLSVPRLWRDQQGRSITATFVRQDNKSVVLQLEDGRSAVVPLSNLSAQDRAFLADISQPADSAKLSVSLTWPTKPITINKTDLQIHSVEENAAERRCIYNSGSFTFNSQAPLSGTVIREIAADFELTNSLFQQLPWGWIPRPANGAQTFTALLFETESDYYAGGGLDKTTGGSRDGYIYTRFDVLGLKKVGERYAFDSRAKQQGSMVSLITRILLGDMRELAMPWAALGAEEFFEYVSYRNGAFYFTNLDKGLKARLNERKNSSYNYQPSVDRLLTLLKTTWDGPAFDRAASLRTERFMDSLLLFYFFGCLDDDGKGTRLHHYLSTVARDQLALRQYMESNRTQPPPAWAGDKRSHALSLHERIIIGERPDPVLREIIVQKFREIGIKI